MTDSDIEDVKLLQERGPDMPAKSGLSFMSMMTTAFTKALLDRVKREFSRMEYDSVARKMDDLLVEFRAYNAELKRISRKKV